MSDIPKCPCKSKEDDTKQIDDSGGVDDGELNTLEKLAKMTVIVADTGDFESEIS